jgi:hypothetical protein
LAREYITHDTDNEANIHVIIELEPEIPAAIPGTMNIPEPIVPPRPRLTRSKRAMVFLYFSLPQLIFISYRLILL